MKPHSIISAHLCVKNKQILEVTAKGNFLFASGDPKADLAYERQYEQQTYHVIPEVIKNFLQYFHKTISDLIDQKVYELQSNRVSSESIEQKIYEIQDVYENRYS